MSTVLAGPPLLNQIPWIPGPLKIAHISGMLTRGTEQVGAVTGLLAGLATVAWIGKILAHIPSIYSRLYLKKIC